MINNLSNLNNFKTVLRPILEAIIAEGGKPYYVGGCVRDSILNLECKDIDIEVFHISIKKLNKVLSQFGEVDGVGKSFGVIKLRYNDIDIDFSLPRTEIKTGLGHCDFSIENPPDITLKEACSRRGSRISKKYLRYYILHQVRSYHVYSKRITSIIRCSKR